MVIICVYDGLFGIVSSCVFVVWLAGNGCGCCLGWLFCLCWLWCVVS